MFLCSGKLNTLPSEENVSAASLHQLFQHFQFFKFKSASLPISRLEYMLDKSAVAVPGFSSVSRFEPDLVSHLSLNSTIRASTRPHTQTVRHVSRNASGTLRRASPGEVGMALPMWTASPPEPVHVETLYMLSCLFNATHCARVPCCLQKEQKGATSIFSVFLY